MEVKTLKGVLLASIQRLQDALREQKKAASEKAAAPSVDYVREIALLQREIARINSDKLALYNTYSDGEISREEYIKGRDSAGESIRVLSEKADLLEQQRQQFMQSLVVLPPAVEYLQDTAEPLQYSNELIAELVKHVVIYSESRIEIAWKHGDEIGAFLSGGAEKS